MMTTLNKISGLTDPKAITAEFKKLPQKEAITAAFQCAIDWVDDGDFMEQIISALGVHRQVQENTEHLWGLKTDLTILNGLDNPFWSTETSVWVALRVCRFRADTGNYKRIGAIANLALKQLHVKA